jgi:site-specific recombinase
VKLPKIIKYLHENHNRLQGNVYFGCVVGWSKKFWKILVP